MLIFPFFLILLVLKLAALALVYHAGPLAAIPVIIACIAIGCAIDKTTAARLRQQEFR